MNTATRSTAEAKTAGNLTCTYRGETTLCFTYFEYEFSIFDDNPSPGHNETRIEIAGQPINRTVYATRFAALGAAVQEINLLVQQSAPTN